MIKYVFYWQFNADGLAYIYTKLFYMLAYGMEILIGVCPTTPTAVGKIIISEKCTKIQIWLKINIKQILELNKGNFFSTLLSKPYSEVSPSFWEEKETY